LQRVYGRFGLRLAAFLFGDAPMLRYGLSRILARMLGQGELIYRPHPYTLYELNPAWRSHSGRSQHNALGFRGAEMSREKPPGRFRIVCMGESTTYCTGIDADDATYPARLAAHLKLLRPDRDIEVVNAGVGGYTSIENLLRYHFHVAPLSPDLIVFYYTHNDAHPRRFPVLSRDYHEYSRSWFEPHFKGGFRGLLVRRFSLASGDIGNLVRRYNETPKRPSANIRNNPPIAFRANMTSLALLARAAGTRVLFVNPRYRGLAKLAQGETKHANPAVAAMHEHRQIIESIRYLPLEIRRRSDPTSRTKTPGRLGLKISCASTTVKTGKFRSSTLELRATQSWMN
jgi:lysophospholipase L1-like esterase